jgi:hypothetical protein
MRPKQDLSRHSKILVMGRPEVLAFIFAFAYGLAIDTLHYMRTNLLNCSNLVSISKNEVF